MALRQIFKTQLTDVTTSEIDPLGSLRYENDKLYKRVKILNVAAATGNGVAGDPVFYKATAAAGIAVHVCTMKASEADAQPIVAGFLTTGVTTAQTTAGVWVWLQVTGLVGPFAVDIAGTPVIGSGVIASTDRTLTKQTTVIESCGVCTNATSTTMSIIAKCHY